MSTRAKQTRILKLLQDRHAQFEILSEEQNETVFKRFVGEFIEHEKRESLILNFRRPHTKQKPLDYHKYFLSSCTRNVTWEVNKGHINLLHWLSSGTKNGSCYLLLSEPWIIGFQIKISSISDRDLFFFSDSYWISFQTRRALCLTRDAETILCEIERGYKD